MQTRHKPCRIAAPWVKSSRSSKQTPKHKCGQPPSLNTQDDTQPKNMRGTYLLKLKDPRRCQRDLLVRSRSTHVGELLCLDGVDLEVVLPAVLPQDHTRIHLSTWPNEQLPPAQIRIRNANWWDSSTILHCTGLSLKCLFVGFWYKLAPEGKGELISNFFLDERTLLQRCYRRQYKTNQTENSCWHVPFLSQEEHTVTQDYRCDKDYLSCRILCKRGKETVVLDVKLRCQMINRQIYPGTRLKNKISRS